MKLKATVIPPVIAAMAMICLPFDSSGQESGKPEWSKPGGSYFSLTLHQPPFPFNPFPELPVTQIKPGVFVYDDREVDYVTLRKELAVFEANQVAARFAAGLLEGGGMMMLMSGGTNLMLSLPIVQGTNVQMTLINANTNQPHDLFGTTTLGTSNPWKYMGRLPAGQTNAVTQQLSGGSQSGIYTTADTFDTDGDTLPDAVEVLVTQTSPQVPDSTENVPPGSPAAQMLTEVQPWLRVGTYSRDERYYWFCSDGSLTGWTTLDNWIWGTGGSRDYTNSITCAVGLTPKQTNSGLIVTWDADGAPTPAIGGWVPVDWIGMYWRVLTGDPALNHYKDYMTAELVLRTGGKALSTRQHLYMFTPTADYWPGPPWGTPVPTEEITMFGEHPDENGHIWRLFPDNARIDVPFNLPEQYTDYIYHGGMRKLQLRITRNGNDITDKNTVVWVGQDISLQCDVRLLPENQSGSVAASNFVWTVPGNAISSWIYNSITAQVLTSFPKTNSTVQYYWIHDNPSLQVQVSAVVNGFTLDAKATFEVRRPSATLRLTPKWHVDVTLDHCMPTAFPHLLTGKRCTTNDAGMLYEFVLNDLKGYQGLYEFHLVQVVKHDGKENLPDFGGGQKSREVLIRALDGIYPYRAWASPDVYGYATDSPASQLRNLLKVFEWRRDEFECYLMFKPSPGIPVPIKQASWSWKGAALYQSNPEGWLEVHPFEHPQPALGTDIYNYPNWTNNISALNNFYTTNNFWFVP